MHVAPEPADTENPRRGIALIVISTVLFATLWMLVKLLSERYSVYEITFFRNFFALIPAIAMVVHFGGFQLLRIHRPLGHVWRSVVGLAGMCLGFLSYHMMPLADAVAISFMSPLVVTALSVPLLGEKVGIHRWSAVIVGFVGVLVIVQPGGGMFLATGSLVAVGAAASNALAIITVRQLNRIDHPVAIVFYFTLFTSLFTVVPLPFVWSTPIGLADWGLLILTGLVGGTAQYFMTRAFSLAPAALVSPFNYASLLWSSMFGWLIWGDVPAAHVYAGAAIVVASGLFILYREQKKKKRA